MAEAQREVPGETLRRYVAAVREEIGRDRFLLAYWGARPELVGLGLDDQRERRAQAGGASDGEAQLGTPRCREAYRAALRLAPFGRSGARKRPV